MTEEAVVEEAPVEVTEEAPVVKETPKSDIDSWLAEQGLEDVSEDDLRGIEVEDEAEEQVEEEKPVEPVVPESAPPKTEEKPPKGFVPTQAVKEAREENRYLKEQLKALQESVDALKKAPAVEAPTETFKVLTKAEFLELAEESPTEAMAYTLELQEYNERKRAEELQEAKKSETLKEINRTLTEAQKAMEEVAPGIFEEDSKVQEELVTFAESIGFGEDLFYLTNPETLVILPGETVPVYLGKQAASILKVLVNAKGMRTPKTDEAALRKQIETELLTKLKNTPPNKTFKSLSDLPTTEPVKIKKVSGVLSEKEFAKLSAKEQEVYLAGEET